MASIDKNSLRIKSALFMALFSLFLFNHQYSLLHFLVFFVCIAWIFPLRLISENSMMISSLFMVSAIMTVTSMTPFQTGMHMFYFIAGFFLFLMVNNLYSKEENGWIIDFLFCCFALVCFAQIPGNFSQKSFYPGSLFLNSSFFGAFLMLYFPRLIRKPLFPWGIAWIICCYATMSRSVWIAVLAGVFFSTLFCGRKKVIILLPILLFLIAFSETGRYRAATTGNETGYSVGRAEIWGNCLEFFRNNPVTGCGYGSFSSLFLDKTGFMKLHAHSFYLEYLQGTGILGIILCIWSLYSVRKHMKRDLIEAILPFLVIQIFSNAFYSYKIVLLFFMMLGYFFSKESEKSQTEYFSRKIILLLLCFMATAISRNQLLISMAPLISLPLYSFPADRKKTLMIMVIPLLLLTSTVLFYSGVEFASQKRWKEASEMFGWSEKLSVISPLACFYQGICLFRSGQENSGFQLIRKANTSYHFYDFWEVNQEIASGLLDTEKKYNLPESMLLKAVFLKRKGLINEGNQLFRETCALQKRLLMTSEFATEALKIIEENRGFITRKIEERRMMAVGSNLMAYWHLSNGERKTAVNYATTALKHSENAKDRFCASFFLKLCGKDIPESELKKLSSSIDYCNDFSVRIFNLPCMRDCGLLSSRIHGDIY